jgi:tetraacyldisaccharide-1-P 4'-kinase
MRLLALAEAQAAKLVTTEKDWVRLSAGPAPVARLQAATRALPVAIVFEERDRDRLAALLDIGLKRRTEDRRP